MNTFGKLFALFLVGAICTTVSADSFPNYGDYDVTTVKFLNVTETGIPDPINPLTMVPLYGEPTGPDNSLLFNPVSFGAYSEGVDSNTVDGLLSLEIEADPNTKLLGIEIRESGDYSFNGQGTSATSVSANIAVLISIEKVNGQLVTYDPFNPFQYEIQLAEEMFEVNLSQSEDGVWSSMEYLNGTMYINLDGYLGGDEAITKISLAIDNTLNASSEAGTEALIHKKMFLIKAYTGEASYVPEPSTFVLMGLGALSLLFFRRKIK